MYTSSIERIISGQSNTITELAPMLLILAGITAVASVYFAAKYLLIERPNKTFFKRLDELN